MKSWNRLAASAAIFLSLAACNDESLKQLGMGPSPANNPGGQTGNTGGQGGTTAPGGGLQPTTPGPGLTPGPGTTPGPTAPGPTPPGPTTPGPTTPGTTPGSPTADAGSQTGVPVGPGPSNPNPGNPGPGDAAPPDNEYNSDNNLNACHMYSYFVCAKTGRCANMPLTAAQADACEKMKALELKCAQVKAVRNSFTTCLEDIQKAACPLVLPPSCSNLFKF